MSELDHHHLLDQQRILIAEEARRRVMAYIGRMVLHEAASGYENDNDSNEGKNS